jgi:signal transduction histidine kinase
MNTMDDPSTLDDYRRMVDRHLAVVAHELRTPLQTLEHFFAIVRTRLDHGEVPSRELVECAASQLRRFSKLIADLADTSRIGDGHGINVQLQPIDLRAVVENVVSLHRETVERRDHHRSSGAHSLHLDVHGDRFAVLGDPARLDQVVFNLIENALKFSPAGGEVRVVLDRHDGWHRLSVSDRGIGIPAGELPRIGERFFRASNAAPLATPGTGMGLAIIQEIVHAHGGRLDIVSTFGEGTTVTVRLAADGA